MANSLRRLLSTTRPQDVIRTVPRTMHLNSPLLPELFRPPVNRSMQSLDRGFFRKVVPLAALTISDEKQIHAIGKQLEVSRDLLRITPIKPLRQDDSSPGAKCFLLKPGVDAKGMVTPPFNLPLLTGQPRPENLVFNNLKTGRGQHRSDTPIRSHSYLR